MSALLIKNTWTRLQARRVVRLAPVLALSVLLGACSGVPDWANPVNLWYDSFGDEDDQIADSSKSTAYKPYPKLAKTPERPAGTSEEQRKQVASGLVADRENAKHTDQQLRSGGTQSAAPPPAPAIVQKSTAMSPSEPKPSVTVMQAAKPVAPQAAPVAPKSTNIDSGRPLSVPSIVQRRARPQAQPTPSAIDEAAGKPLTRMVQRPASAPAAVSVPMQPAVTQPTSSMVTGSTPMLNANLPIGSDQSALAQAFNSGISQQAAMMGPVGTSQGFQPPGAKPIGNFRTSVPGVIQQNYNSSLIGQRQPSIGGGQMLGLNNGPVVIHFGHSSTGLTAQARSTIANVARSVAQSGRGVRVVGHASQRTRDMNYQKHKRANFNVSLDRAGAVADVLRKNGVPAERIIVEARGSDQPVYHEFMPQGEAYNRRVEIFIQ